MDLTEENESVFLQNSIKNYKILSHELHRGVTLYPAIGGYNNRKRDLILAEMNMRKY